MGQDGGWDDIGHKLLFNEWGPKSSPSPSEVQERVYQSTCQGPCHGAFCDPPVLHLIIVLRKVHAVHVETFPWRRALLLFVTTSCRPFESLATPN